MTRRNVVGPIEVPGAVAQQVGDLVMLKALEGAAVRPEALRVFAEKLLKAAHRGGRTPDRQAISLWTLTRAEATAGLAYLGPLTLAPGELSRAQAYAIDVLWQELRNALSKRPGAPRLSRADALERLSRKGEDNNTQRGQLRERLQLEDDRNRAPIVDLLRDAKKRLLT